MHRLTLYCYTIFHCTSLSATRSTVYMLCVMGWIFCHVFLKLCGVSVPFCAWVHVSANFVLHSSSSFLLLISFRAPVSGGRVGAGLPRSAGRSVDTRADPSFPVGEFIRNYGAYLDLRQLATMSMSVHSKSVWYITFQLNRDIAVGTWETRWWHWGGLGASVCIFVLPGLDSPFVCCLKKIFYEEALELLSDAMWKLVISEIPAGTKCFQLWRLFESFFLPENLTYLVRECDLEYQKHGAGVVLSSVGTTLGYTACQGQLNPLLVSVVRGGGMNTIVGACWRCQSAGVLVLLRSGTPPRTGEICCLEHCGHRVYCSNWVSISLHVSQRYCRVHISQSYLRKRVGCSGTCST